jgi:Ty3 transposon capsid-like protein
VVEPHLEMTEMNMDQPPVSSHIPTQAEIAAFVQQQVQAALASQQRPVSIKPATPRSYSGDKGADPEVWLFQYEQCARLYNLTDAEKVDHAATYLEGAAATWWRSVALASDRSGSPRPAWDSFKAQLITLFKPVNASKVARDRLAELKQTGAVFRYNTDFNRLVLEAGNVSAEEQLHRYIRGLKPKIRVEVELADPQTVHAAMEKAQRIDTITWYARTEYNSSYKSTPAFGGNTYVPMDLGALKVDPTQVTQLTL